MAKKTEKPPIKPKIAADPTKDQNISKDVKKQFNQILNENATKRASVQLDFEQE